MKKWFRVVGSAVVLAGLSISVFVGCNILQYQFCITNLTAFNLDEINIVPQGASSWGANDLSAFIAPGGEQDIKGFAPGTYMVRAVFDVTDATGLCGSVINGELIVTNNELTITTTNICIDYDEQVESAGKGGCTDVYGAAHFEI